MIFGMLRILLDRFSRLWTVWQKKPASCSDVVDVLSHEVQQKLDRIHNRLMELQNISDLNEPLYYETSKQLSFPSL